jgi:pimeloyl-ACP methyl ester carboxylesterase
MESRDIEGWIEQINARDPKGSIMLHGLSMGGGIVLDLATKELKNVRCMIADAPSTSIPEFLKNIAGSAFKKGQLKILACVHDRFYREFSATVTDFDRIQNIKSGKYPLLLSAGSNEKMDNVLYALKEHNPNETTVLILPGCNHGNGMYKQTELYQDAIKVFAEKHMAS